MRLRGATGRPDPFDPGRKTGHHVEATPEEAMETSVQADFWKNRWEQHQLGWHQPKANPALVREWPGLGLDASAPVFVPLCGKSLDMHWLRERGHEIVGCELSPIACREFFAEAEIPVTPVPDGARERYEAAGYRLICGDFFDLTPEDLEGVGGVFDRGALIALPPAMRARYAEHMAHILPAAVEILLVTLEYDQSVVDGPPHSVPTDEVEALFGRSFAAERLHLSEPSKPQQPRFEAAGLEVWQEAIWRITRTPGGSTGATS